MATLIRRNWRLAALFGHIGRIAHHVLAGDLAREIRDGAEDGARNLRRITAGADRESVIAVVRRVGKIAGNIFINVVERAFDLTAGLSVSASEIVLGIGMEAKGRVLMSVNRHQIALRDLDDFLQVFLLAVSCPSPMTMMTRRGS